MPIPFEDDLDPPDFSCRTNVEIKEKSQFIIYPISHLPALIEVLRENIPPKHTVLFLMDDSGHMWFAGEQKASPDIETRFRIPMHYQMTGKPTHVAFCMTAGVLELSEDYSTIIRMSNKSCNFKPSFDSLKWAIATLVANQDLLKSLSIQFASELNLEEYATLVGGFQGTYHSLKMEEFTTWAQKVFEKQMPHFLKQPTEIKRVIYEPPLQVTGKGDFFDLSQKSADRAKNDDQLAKRANCTT